MKQDRRPPKPAAKPKGRALRQVAALPWRRRADGRVEVLLATSRETRRWIVPKGWPIKGLSDVEAAAREAWEEAGVRGAVDPKPLGSFEYVKLMPDGAARRARTTVWRLEVTEEHADWPERAERERAWFPAAEAAALVAEPGLAALLAALD